MNAHKKDFENAVEMIDWQNKMLKQQADEIEALKKTISSLFGGLEASLDLNKAQAIRRVTDAKE
jgi:hypothetical protein